MEAISVNYFSRPRPFIKEREDIKASRFTSTHGFGQTGTDSFLDILGYYHSFFEKE